MNALFSDAEFRQVPDLPDGAHLVPGFLTPEQQRWIVGQFHRWAAGPVPLRHTKIGGGVMSVETVCLGWHWRPYEYTREAVDVNGRRVLDVPDWMVRLGRAALTAVDDPHAAQYTPDVALVNYYDDAARMGMHQDKDERSMAPVVSLSIGDTARFRLGNTQTRSKPYHDIDLHSGDLFVFGGPSRLAFHGVTKIYPRHCARRLRSGVRQDQHHDARHRAGMRGDDVTEGINVTGGINGADTAGIVIGDDGLARPAWASVDPMLRDYYDTEWGMPVRDEHGMYERLSLEAFQSGLSWATILRKRPAFREAFARFDPDVVAAFGDDDVERLMNDAGIVRNRAKIRAAITNARATIDLRDKGGLAAFVWSFQPAQTPRPSSIDEIPTQSDESKALAKALRKEGFAFVGPTTMFALMEAVGIVDTHLVGSHRRGTSGVWPE